MTRLRSHLPSAIVATFVLVVAMAASATAATLITSAQIKDNTVASIDLRNGTVAGIDVKDGTIASVDIANGSVTSADLAGSARLALVGAPCTVPTYGAGTVQLTVGTSGAISFKCVNSNTTDHDGDEFSIADGDCNDNDGAVFPGAFELLNGIDDDCDDALATGVTFYTGPAETEGVGPCHAGIGHETSTDPFFAEDEPEVTPTPEVLGNEIDEDCDGVLDNA